MCSLNFLERQLRSYSGLDRHFSTRGLKNCNDEKFFSTFQENASVVIGSSADVP